MAGANDTETVKIDIHVSGKDKINRTVQDGEGREGKPPLQCKSEPESWFDQVSHRYRYPVVSPNYKELETSPDVSIYRVPESIKKTKRGAYDPLVVFLGPYHHKKHQQLTAMDDYKLQAVDKTLTRLGMNMENVCKEVEGLVKEIKNCYEDSATEWTDKTLAWMMTMDACFILEFLRMDLSHSNLIFHFQRSDNIKRREVMLDILKLENQIPFCILKMILKLELKDPALVPGFLAKLLSDSSCIYFQGYPFLISSRETEIAKHIESGPLHLLDLSRRVIVHFLSNSASPRPPPRSCCECKTHCGAFTCIATPKVFGCFRGGNWTLLPRFYPPNKIPSAEKLQRAGIKLQKSTEGKFEFKRRCLRRSKLFLPRITVDDYTEIFLRNLVVFEECQRQDNSPIESVISLNMCIMDNLIDSKEDVELFQRAGIIENYLGTDDEVAQIFNDLCFGITTQGDFQQILNMINEDYNSQLNVWITELRKRHCSRPWYLISLGAAVILLVLTLLQTIYTIKS